jgi:hypothetical protein
MPVADLAQQLPVLGRRHVHAGRGRDRFTDDRGNRLRTLVDDLLLDIPRRHQVGFFPLQSEVGPVTIRVRHVIDAVHEWTEPGFVAGCCDTHRAVGHAMVGAATGDDLVALGEATHRLDLLGDLDRGFDGLGATRDEEEPAEVAGSQLCELFGQLDRGCGRVGHRRSVCQARSLVGVRLRDFAPAVAGVDDPQTGNAVEILPALHVVEASAFTAVEDAEVVAFELGPR